jgi:hypothetical protein
MTRKQADAAFDSLRRHAAAITAPSSPADALKLLDRAVLSKLQRDAMIHYISVGPDNLALAYAVLKAGAAAFAAAGFAAASEAVESAEPLVPGEIFAARCTDIDVPGVDSSPAEHAIGLIDRLTAGLVDGRAVLGASAPTAEDRHAGVSGLLDAAASAYVLARLLEDPPRAAVGAGPTPRPPAAQESAPPT